LGVQQILVGQVTHQSNTPGYTVSARTMDVSTSKIISSVSEEFRPGSEDEAMRWLTDQIAFAQRPDLFSRMEIDVQPSDAVIKALGNEHRGFWRAARISQAGPVPIMISCPGYFDLADTVILSFGKTIRKSYILRQKTGTLKITSIPDSAQVFVDGHYAGFTPLNKTLTEGIAAVRIVKDGFLVVEDSVSLHGGAAVQQEYLLKKSAGSIDVTTEPDNAYVSINGIDVGRTPLHNFALDTGRCAVVVSKPAYHSQAETLFVTHGSVIRKHYALRPNIGALSVRSEPAGALVALNGRNIGKTPFSDKSMAAGRYQLGISSSGYISILDTVEILGGSDLNRNFVLVHTQEYFDSAKTGKEHAKLEAEAKRARDKKTRQWVRRIGFGTLAVGSFIYGVAMDGVYANHIKDRDGLLEKIASPNISAQDKSAYKDQYNDLTNKTIPNDQLARNIGYIAAGLFAAGFTLSIWF
jgi:hypothetical protein